MRPCGISFFSFCMSLWKTSAWLSNFPTCNKQVVASSSLVLSTHSLFTWLISHQPAALFSQNKPASSTFLSE
jgi:hypothetical protein